MNPGSQIHIIDDILFLSLHFDTVGIDVNDFLLFLVVKTIQKFGYLAFVSTAGIKVGKSLNLNPHEGYSVISSSKNRLAYQTQT